MKSTSILIALLALISIAACKSSSKTRQSSQISAGDNSRTSLDWDGMYNGILPCADCAGIQTMITLNKDMSYTMKTKYIGKSEDVNTTTGTFSWNDAGNIITLGNIKPGVQPTGFFAGENALAQLDMNGNRIPGDLANNYILQKSMSTITETYWKLVELNGKPVVRNPDQQKEAFMILKSEGNRVIGNGGCNSFNGSYELKEGDRIQFSKVATTMMACPDMETEIQFFKVLGMADNYNHMNDTLVLNKAKMAPLARFVAAYLK